MEGRETSPSSSQPPPNHSTTTTSITSNPAPPAAAATAAVATGGIAAAAAAEGHGRPPPTASAPLPLPLGSNPNAMMMMMGTNTTSNTTAGTTTTTTPTTPTTLGPVKRKRGRPRKYVEGSSPPVLISSVSPAAASGGLSGAGAGGAAGNSSSGGGVALALAPLAAAGPGYSSPTGTTTTTTTTTERKRGRPPGSGKKQQLAALGAWLAGSAGQGFTPHVITIAAGEDVATKIMSFSQIGPRATCVLSANGAISNVTLRQPATSGGTVTYEGRFEILSLSGSFLLTENGNTRSRTGGLSVSLAGPDGRVVGGSVAGLLVAATPVQVVVGSFIAETRKTPVQVRPSSVSSSDMLAAAASPVSSPRPAGTSALKESNSSLQTQMMNWAGGQQEEQPAGRGTTDINIPPPPSS